MDEVFVIGGGKSYLLWSVVDQQNAEFAVLLQKRRDNAATERFFMHLLTQYPSGPCKSVTDQLRSYPAAKADIPKLAKVKGELPKRRPAPATTAWRTAISANTGA
jgi:putative transposase